MIGLGLIGKKLGMSQIFDEHGNIIPVTLIKAGPCTVVQKKTTAKEGYNALQIGFEEIMKAQRTYSYPRGPIGGLAERQF